MFADLHYLIIHLVLSYIYPHALQIDEKVLKLTFQKIL